MNNMKRFIVEYIGENNNLDVETLFMVIKQNIKDIDSSNLSVKKI